MQNPECTREYNHRQGNSNSGKVKLCEDLDSKMTYNVLSRTVDIPTHYEEMNIFIRSNSQKNWAKTGANRHQNEM